MAFALGVAALAGAPAAARAQAAYVIIVNAANPISSIGRSELSKMFLRKIDRWPSGQAVVPIDLSESSPIRAVFTKEVHGKSVAAVESYWQQQIFSGKNVPPITKASDEEVIAYVRANPSAIGYVSVKAGAGAGIKPVALTN